MIGSSAILPSYPGYALGSIIGESELRLPLYQKRRIELNEELERTTQALEVASNAEKRNQTHLNEYPIMILRYKKEIESIDEKIKECINGINFFEIQEALPLDDKYVKLYNDKRCFKMERLNHITFTKQESYLNRLESFVADLFLQDAPRTFLPTGSLEAIEKSIQSIVNSAAARVRVTVVGSFITLEKQKRIDPLVIRPNTRMREELTKNASKYFVLTEAVLGAVFLGIGKAIEVDASEKSEKATELDSKKILSNFATVSFISQGAIPRLNRDIQDVNLWSTYVDWKDSVVKDEDSGYPIGFKVRSLENVLQENNMLPKERK